MKLSEARVEAGQCWMKLEVWMTDKGYIWARGEGADFLTPKDQQTDHLRTGLHSIGLAQDYVLYEKDPDSGDLIYLTDGREYEDLNSYWLTIHPFCRLVAGDANHFSFSDHSIPGCTAPNGQLRT